MDDAARQVRQHRLERLRIVERTGQNHCALDCHHRRLRPSPGFFCSCATIARYGGKRTDPAFESCGQALAEQPTTLPDQKGAQKAALPATAVEFVKRRHHSIQPLTRGALAVQRFNDPRI